MLSDLPVGGVEDIMCRAAQVDWMYPLTKRGWFMEGDKAFQVYMCFVIQVCYMHGRRAVHMQLGAYEAFSSQESKHTHICV